MVYNDMDNININTIIIRFNFQFGHQRIKYYTGILYITGTNGFCFYTNKRRRLSIYKMFERSNCSAQDMKTALF